MEITDVSQRRMLPQHLFCPVDGRMVLRVQGQSTSCLCLTAREIFLLLQNLEIDFLTLKIKFYVKIRLKLFSKPPSSILLMQHFAKWIPKQEFYHRALQQKKMKAVWAEVSCCVFDKPKNMKHGNFPHMFDRWANSDVHLLLLKSPIV